MSTKTIQISKGEVKLTMNGGVSLYNIWATLNGKPLMDWMPEDKSAVDVRELCSKIGELIYANGEDAADWKAIQKAIDKLVDGEYEFVNALDNW